MLRFADIPIIRETYDDGKDILEFYIFMLSGRDLMSLPVVWRSDLVSDRPRHQM